MAYAQRNYGQIQGINGRYTIAQIGCFITAFCNLLERYGRGVDPATLNSVFVNRGIYIDVDDGIRDDVGWGSISAFDGNVVVTGTGAGAPPSNDAIVKFNYRSPNTGQFTTHFCLVLDRNAGTIIDSWDGQVKSWNVYGGPVAYATYANTKPQPVTPVQPVGGVDDMSINRDEIIREYRVNRGADPAEEEIQAHLAGGNMKSLSFGFEQENAQRRAAQQAAIDGLNGVITELQGRLSSSVDQAAYDDVVRSKQEVERINDELESKIKELESKPPVEVPIEVQVV